MFPNSAVIFFIFFILKILKIKVQIMLNTKFQPNISSGSGENDDF